mmetsp:Transcript_86007/g.238247  ORF Transcript_86007/g.238247 Transcript_86007/m.238247 type:complete len:256 (-) Transcript_86007:246-1013(-)|eukprot:CAMPEP_0179075590 /NCGR_PEP_ID=MMETSP0796-20121207/33670_1 /TAXON_ID=73915 /ORGANISM="Pyrodinium bahamense, Strain pbaha01" /LENGTH=255 /DNA_ID=CAMNT_0020772829 /DNA_START=49 /DNA_END=816 /DNA_ORIENTATION=-
MATEVHARRPSCWVGARLLWDRWGLGLRGCVEKREAEVKSIVYASRHEAMAEVVLEGGDGDAAYFWKVRPGTKAESAGIRPGDQLLQVNCITPELLFHRPADEILAPIQGPVILYWKSTPPRPPGEKTRLNPKKPMFSLEEDVDEDDVIQPYPVSKATAADPGEWLCGSCDATNFDNQEYCRRCGIRDSRLPKRPGLAPVFNISHRAARPDKPPVLFAYESLTKKDAQGAAMEGHRFADPTGQPVDRSAPPPTAQ